MQNPVCETVKLWTPQPKPHQSLPKSPSQNHRTTETVKLWGLRKPRKISALQNSVFCRTRRFAANVPILAKNVPEKHRKGRFWGANIPHLYHRARTTRRTALSIDPCGQTKSGARCAPLVPDPRPVFQYSRKSTSMVMGTGTAVLPSFIAGLNLYWRIASIAFSSSPMPSARAT